MKNTLSLSFLVILFGATLSCVSKSKNENDVNLITQKKDILIIGHRGACGYRPEHTLASYTLAIEMGADYIEPDLVMTKDGVLIARHENEISTTTNVATQFPKRKTTKLVDGKKIEGWFTEDFTLAEIKKLKANERLAFRDHTNDGKFDIPTFEEIIVFLKKKELETHRTIGIYPELKHSSYFSAHGLKLEDTFLKLLKKYGYVSFDSPIIVQSFEVENLKYLHQRTPIKLMQLFDEPQEKPYDFVIHGDSRTYSDMTSPEALKEIATYAKVVGPYKRYIIPVDDKNHTLPPTHFIQDAHAAGLLVHPYTFRNESQYLAEDYKNDPNNEYQAYFKIGVDGLFSDFAETAVKAKTFYLEN